MNDLSALLEGMGKPHGFPESNSSEQEEKSIHQNLLEINHVIKQRKTDEIKINHFSPHICVSYPLSTFLSKDSNIVWTKPETLTNVLLKISPEFCF